jgi:S1-C subfamily serine protease
MNTLLAFLLLVVQAAERKEATLGVVTRAPTKKEIGDYSLKGAVRTIGQVVTEVEKESPADKAGIAVGDVILQIDANKFQSKDSLDDFVRVAKPGAEVTAKVIRAWAFKEEDVKITLGERKSEAAGLLWHFAGIEQLPAALKKAKDEGKTVLVGLSGAET